MTTLITNISSLITVDAKGKEFKAGKEMSEIGEIINGAVLFDENIIWVGTADEASKKISDGSINADKIIDASGKTLIPGFADSHTHIVFWR